MILNILTPKNLYDGVRELMNTHNMTTIDAIVHYCEKNDVDIETAAAMIAKNMNMVSDLQSEGEGLRLLPRTTRLPI